MILSLKNLSVIITLLLHSIIAKGVTTYCNDNFNLYNLWPNFIEKFTVLATEVCCEKENMRVEKKVEHVILLQIHMKIDSAIKIRNENVNGDKPVEIFCDESSKNKCNLFKSVAKMPQYNKGLMLRVYNYDVKDNDITYSANTPPFFDFSRIKGRSNDVKVVGANDANMICQAKSESNQRNARESGDKPRSQGKRKKSPSDPDKHAELELDNNPA